MLKTVLVTGSSRGIGKAIAVKFTKKGYNVIINCVNSAERLAQVKKEIESYNVPCLSYVGDIGIYENAKEMFSLAKKTFGSIDIVINNAGISYVGLLQDMNPDMWDNIIRTNLTSIYNTSHLAIPDMVSKKCGCILNISSVWGVAGASCEVAYSATKGAVNAFSKALAKELAPSGIKVIALALGAIDTEMNHFLDDSELIELINEIPSGRLGTATETADLVYGLATRHPYLTGQTIVMDGGWI